MTAPVLTPAERAAVLVMLLDDEQAVRIIGALAPDELRVLGERMCALGAIGPDLVTSAIAGFVAETEALGHGATDRPGQLRQLMTRAVGEVKADNMMRRIRPEARPPSPLEIVRWLEPAVLAPLVAGEHPQAIAVLLVQLEPEAAAAVLHALPAAAQPDVLHRVATLGPVTGEALAMLEAVLTRRIGERHGHEALAMGGPAEAAEIINSSGKAMEKHVIPEIARIDKALAREIEGEMFKFEHLFVLDPQAMGALLREVESDMLINALKGIGEAEREVFFRAMSSRAADGVRDEIAARGRTKIGDVVAAQKAVVAIAKRLVADGAIAIGQGDAEYV